MNKQKDIRDIVIQLYSLIDKTDLDVFNFAELLMKQFDDIYIDYSIVAKKLQDISSILNNK